MISTVVFSLLRRFILPEMNYKIYAFPSKPLTQELFYPPGLFKIDKSSNRHRFYSFSVHHDQILS